SVENPKVKNKWEAKNFNVQLINFKSKYKPFIVFEPGGKMYIFDRNIKELEKGTGCDHWPVGQMRCDGRTNQAFDRPTHFLSFPITDPIIHEKEDRCWWNGLYGLTDKPFNQLMKIAKSWLNAPQVTINGEGFSFLGYDRSERAYKILKSNEGTDSSLEIKIEAGQECPLYNPALVIMNWGEKTPELRIGGKLITPGKMFRYGHNYRLEGTDLIIWLQFESESPCLLQIAPSGK
ncbi:MAG: hypothetical protein H5U07_09545, partial [Candidatus Aminicenantes bacterium]|nr:hypothetical protein [Candidatus Aminicenantes bacterium]